MDVSYRCLDHAFKTGPRGRFFPMRRDIRDLMSEIHSEEILRDKPDCGVIDPAWCKDEGQNYPIPCNTNTIITFAFPLIIMSKCFSS